MESKRTVLYCRHLAPSAFDSLQYDSAMHSRMLQLRDVGLDFLMIGRSETGCTERRLGRNFKACFVDVMMPGKDLVAEVRKAFPECGSVPLVIARDLPTARYTLRLARALQSVAYYHAVEVWTGYHVVDGKRIFPDFYKSYLRERLWIRRFKRIFAHSYPAEEYLIRLYRLPKDCIDVLYSVLPMPKPQERNFPILDSVKSSDRLIICSGALAPKRGLEALIECFALMPDNYKLLMFGQGPLKSRLEQMVLDRNLTNKVLFQENIPIEEYHQLLKQGDVGIDFRSESTLNYDLNMSCRVIDYINCGVPIITTSTKGFRDIEDRLGVVKCVPNTLAREQQAELISRYCQEYFNDRDLTAGRLKHAIESEFSYEVNERRFRRALTEDGII